MKKIFFGFSILALITLNILSIDFSNNISNICLKNIIQLAVADPESGVPFECYTIETSYNSSFHQCLNDPNRTGGWEEGELACENGTGGSCSEGYYCIVFQCIGEEEYTVPVFPNTTYC